VSNNKIILIQINSYGSKRSIPDIIIAFLLLNVFIGSNRGKRREGMDRSFQLERD
jgi:hypothetical protein